MSMRIHGLSDFYGNIAALKQVSGLSSSQRVTNNVARGPLLLPLRRWREQHETFPGGGRFQDALSLGIVYIHLLDKSKQALLQ